MSEIQTVRCSLPGKDTFTVSFRGDTSRPISANATDAQIKWALENMTTLQEVHVSINPGERACQTRWDGNDWRHGSSGFNVTFISQVGDVPLLTTSPPSERHGDRQGHEGESRVRAPGLLRPRVGIVPVPQGLRRERRRREPRAAAGLRPDRSPGVHAEFVGRVTGRFARRLRFTRVNPRDWYFSTRPGVVLCCAAKRSRHRLRAHLRLVDLGRYDVVDLAESRAAHAHGADVDVGVDDGLDAAFGERRGCVE